MSVLPPNVIGAWLSSSPAPLNDASPATVSGAARVLKLWLTLQEKLPATVTSPPDSDASVSVRSCSCVPPGTPVTEGLACDWVGAIVTLSPLPGTDMLAQFWASVQLVPSPSPVHVWLDDALAAAGASTSMPTARTPGRQAAASLRRAGPGMVTSQGPRARFISPWCRVY